MSDAAIKPFSAGTIPGERTALSDQEPASNLEGPPTARNFCVFFSGPAIAFSGMATGAGLMFGLDAPVLGLGVSFGAIFVGIAVSSYIAS